MNKCVKNITAFILSISLMGTMTSAVYAADAFHMELVDALNANADFNNVTVTAYYLDKDGSDMSTEEIVLKSGNSVVSFNPPSDSYGFAYKVVDSDGRVLKDYTKLFSGKPVYWVSANDNMQISVIREDVSLKNEDIDIKDDSVVSVDFNALLDTTKPAVSISSTDIVPDNMSEAQIEGRKHIIVKTTSDCNLQLVEKEGYSLIATAEDNSREQLNITSLNDMQFNLTQDCDYTFNAISNDIYLDYVISDGTMGVVTVEVKPSCILYVINGNNPININTAGYNFKTDKNLSFAVKNGANYEIVDVDTNTLYSITIPMDVHECILDLSTFSGVPYDGQTTTIPDNENTQNLPNSTASVANNPYNIPQTSDMKNSHFSDIFGVIIGIAMSCSAYILKRKKS